MSEKKRENSNNAEALPSESNDERMDELLEMYDRAYKIEDPREKIAVYVELAKEGLEEMLGIKRLTNIEGVHLRNIVENLQPRFEEELKLVFEGKMDATNMFSLEEEAAALWLYEVYGIHRNDIPRVCIVKDNTDGREYKYENAEEEAAEEKSRELRSKGHKFQAKYIIPDDFKEYVRRLRENTHGTEVFETKKKTEKKKNKKTH